MSSFADPMPVRASIADEAGIAAIALRPASGTHRATQSTDFIWVGFLNAVLTMASLPFLFTVTLLLLVLNPFLNPGPIIFRQERAGRGGRVFRIYKFRTMTEAPDEGATTCITANEARITALGCVLRKYRIDELPNFINVALGDMNVVGPRPDAKEQADIYARTVPGYRARFEVKPGITGLAQVKQGYAACQASTRKKARYDRFYVRNRDAAMDILVILKTFKVLRTGFGSR